MMISFFGTIIRLGVSDISTMGRTTQGVRLMKMGDGDRVVSVAKTIVEELEKIEKEPQDLDEE